MEYRHMLVTLKEECNEEELKNMKYLCKEFIGRRHIEGITSFLDLFDCLEKQEKLGPNNLKTLYSLLKTACPKRIDVLRVVEKYAHSCPNNGGLEVADLGIVNNFQVPCEDEDKCQSQGKKVTPTQSTYSPRDIGPPLENVTHVRNTTGYPQHENSEQVHHYNTRSSSQPKVNALLPVQQEVNFLCRKLGREWRFLIRVLGVCDSEINEQENLNPRSIREQIYGCFRIWAENPKSDVSQTTLIKALKDPAVERIDLAHSIEKGRHIPQ